MPVPGRNLRRRRKPRHGSRGRVGSGTGPLFRLRGRPHNAGPSSVRHLPKPRRRMRHLPQATARLFLGRRCGSRPGRPGVRALRFSPRTGSSRVVRNIPQGEYPSRRRGRKAYSITVYVLRAAELGSVPVILETCSTSRGNRQKGTDIQSTFRRAVLFAHSAAEGNRLFAARP